MMVRFTGGRGPRRALILPPLALLAILAATGFAGCTPPGPSPAPQASASERPAPAPPPKTIAVGLHRLTIAGHTLEVEVAADPTKRATGLMYRDRLPEDGGMLFVFPEPQMQGFWMKNCLIDLDIAYLDDEGVIVDLLRMKVPSKEHPNVFPRYRSTRKVRYALETNAGWFEARGIGPGAKVEGYRGPANIRPQ